MHFPLLLTSTCLFYTSLFFISASAQSSNAPDTSSSDCLNPNKDPTPACWDSLNVTANLLSWWQENEADCDQNYTGQGFASCYQQKVGQGVLLGQRCDLTGPSLCTRPGNFSSYEPQEFYALSSIFAIWQWFNSIYYALDPSQNTASERVGVITKAINPATTQQASVLGDVLQVLTIGISALSLPGAMLESTTSRVLMNALQQAPIISNAIYDPGTLESQFYQINDIENSLSQVVDTFRSNIANALAALQPNITNFIAFTAHGSFIAPDSSLNISVSNLTAALTTYVVSQSLLANQYYLYFTPNTNPYEVRHNGSLPSQYNDDVNCQNPPDQYGVCDKWFYDGTDAYQLVQDGGVDKKSTDQFSLMETIFSNGWTTGEELFAGAKDCAVYSLSQNFTASNPVLDQNTLQPQCISSIGVQMFESDTSCFWIGEFGYWKTPHDTDSGCNGVYIFLAPPSFGPFDARQYRESIRNSSGLLNAYLVSLGV
ncbi:hypothetical protein MMC12_007498 [Toensbergia leucococca]|nr:hypothetical protein [Toensbergia leucococca]